MQHHMTTFTCFQHWYDGLIWDLVISGATLLGRQLDCWQLAASGSLASSTATMSSGLTWSRSRSLLQWSYGGCLFECWGWLETDYLKQAIELAILSTKKGATAWVTIAFITAQTLSICFNYHWQNLLGLLHRKPYFFSNVVGLCNACTIKLFFTKLHIYRITSPMQKYLPCSSYATLVLCGLGR